ncbi:MAG: hypothetical protein HKO69_05535 [Woeseiaceae bacterium]|nr:hypothetical protein [Woeseiaceae bacterium]
MDRVIDREFNDLPLSESSVTMKLASIQQRCKELLADPDETVELTLEDPEPTVVRGSNPYERG